MTKEVKASKGQTTSDPLVTNRIFTIPNVISVIRLCLVPTFLVLLLDGHDILAAFIFALAAGTDWVDGQIARRTETVTKLGQLLDPAVDRILIISAVIGLLIVSRLPIWVIVLVIARDGILLIGGAVLLRRYKIRVPVIFPGKVATTLLFIGFAGLILNWPMISGLGMFDVSWLPGLNGEPFTMWIWFVYAGVLLAYFVACYYVISAYRQLKEALRATKEE